MGKPPLQVFVSGKEEELDDERAIAIQTVENDFHLNAIASENRPASHRAIEDQYLDEVRSSDIYVGFFGKEYSEASEKEFSTARREGMPVLIFIKELRGNDSRNPKLSQFIQDIKHPKNGITYDEYEHVVDMNDKLAKALAGLLSETFREAKKLKEEKEGKPIGGEKEEVKTGISEKTAELLGAPNQLGQAAFITFDFPDKVKRGTSTHVSAKVQGTSDRGFLDLLIVDAEGKRKFYPDPKSWNSALDLGQLKLHNEPYASTWEFVFSEKRQSGRYKAIVALYDDTSDLPARNRKVVAYEEKEFEVE